jgi:hypothetical protein
LGTQHFWRGPRHKSRLPPDVKAEILATMPSDEEMERLFREMQLKGGLTFEEFAASIGLNRGAQP